MSTPASGQTSSLPGGAPWMPDRGDGTYRNPVLHADYSDPDVVRVGDDYFLTASSFTCVPGLPILHSRDLVNWRLIHHALPRLQPVDHFAVPRHGGGVWAPSIRHHEGRFWIYYPDPDFGLYLVTAIDPAGPWSEPVLVVPGKGRIDPCPLWSDDGHLYLIHGWAKSRSGFCNVLTLLRLQDDGRAVAEDFGFVIEGDKVNCPDFHTLEGPKLYQRNGWTYILAPAGGVATGWQSVFRARDIRGPYEHRIVLHQGGTDVNGPHQGALVETVRGEWWFLHFQDRDAYGRVVHLQPVQWLDDWPMMGTATSPDTPGEPVIIHAKPLPPADDTTNCVPATSDIFDAPSLGLQWQWQANPQADWMTLDAGARALRLFAQPDPSAGNLYDAPHLLLQKFPAARFTVTIRIDLPTGVSGITAGLIIFGYDYAWIGLRATAAGVAVVHARCIDAMKQHPQSESPAVAVPDGGRWLRATVRPDALCQFSSSPDGVHYEDIGSPFVARCGKWVGAKVGLFASADTPDRPPGWADFRQFIVQS